jgi:diadenosine tetraphosphate (Ap4A) HIT family hydrolase
MRKTTLRSPEMHERYITTPKDPDFMNTANSIRDFNYWRIIENKFPYDTIAETHHLLVPKRQVKSWLDMNIEELDELDILITHTLPQAYDMILLNFPKAQSVKDWLHFQLIVVKEV